MAHNRASETEATTCCLCLLATSHFVSYWTALVLPQEGPNLSPQTKLSFPPHTTTLPTTTCSGKYNLAVSFHVYRIFHTCFVDMTHFFQFIIYGPTMGRAETQPRDWIWPPALHHCLANINRQRQVYFCGEILGPLHVLRFFIAIFNIFYLNCCGPNMGMAKTQPTDWVWPPSLHHCLAYINGQRHDYFEG